MKTTLIAAFFLLCAPIFAQVSDDAAKLALQVQNKKDALDAFRNGDQTTGLAKLTGNVSKDAKAPKEEIQMVAQLTEATYWLANERHPRAAEIALLTIAQTENSRTKLTPSEEASALSRSGELYERVVGDPVKAKASYEAALQRDNAQPTALRGLAKLRALQALVETKARENDALRARAQNPIR